MTRFAVALFGGVAFAYIGSELIVRLVTIVVQR